MSRAYYYFLLICILGAGVVAGWLIWQRADGVKEPESNLGELYRAKGDTVGRTVLYRSKLGQKIKYGGVGEVKQIVGGQEGVYVVGLMESVVDISGSKDKYLTLIDPITDEEIGKYRLAFDKSEKWTVTGLGKEIVLTGKIIHKKSEEGEDLWDKIAADIKYHDAVVLLPQYGTDKKVVWDDEGKMVVGWLLIRRDNEADI